MWAVEYRVPDSAKVMWFTETGAITYFLEDAARFSTEEAAEEYLERFPQNPCCQVVSTLSYQYGSYEMDEILGAALIDIERHIGVYLSIIRSMTLDQEKLKCLMTEDGQIAVEHSLRQMQVNQEQSARAAK